MSGRGQSPFQICLKENEDLTVKPTEQQLHGHHCNLSKCHTDGKWHKKRGNEAIVRKSGHREGKMALHMAAFAVAATKEEVVQLL